MILSQKDVYPHFTADINELAEIVCQQKKGGVNY